MSALFWIALVFSIASVVVFFYYFAPFKKDENLNIVDKKHLKIFIGTIISFTLCMVLIALGVVLKKNYRLDALHIVMLIFGSLIFGFAFIVLIETFVLYFYKPALTFPNRKLIKWVMFGSIPILLIFLILLVEAYAPYLSYPLASGYSFKDNSFLYGNEMRDGLVIKWYGVIILTGAIIAYFVCDHHFYLEYKKHGIIDALFILVFLVGILGARFWAVYVLPSERGIDFFDFQSGGLGIMGGVIFGAIAGITFLIFFRRYINLRHAMDLILPCVLIAQAIGRWGNFFNQEVYGNFVDEKALSFLPLFIRNNMYIIDELGAGYRVPLFLIESIMNFIGYFVIVYACGKGAKKHLSFGDQFCLYSVWYGLTRIILESLRNKQFYNLESEITAWVMFGGGIIAIIALHIYDYFRWGKRTFKIIDNPRLHDPRNPYYCNDSKSYENH